MTNHCTHAQVIALKEIGFDMEVRDYYLHTGRLLTTNIFQDWNKDLYADSSTSAPTRSEVLQWAREKHNIDAWVFAYQTVSLGKKYGYTVFDVVDSYELYPTYPEAEDALIDKIIEIIKTEGR